MSHVINPHEFNGHEEPVKVASGDEWARYTYRGVEIFDTSCGCAGCYSSGQYLGRNLDDAVKKIDQSLR